MTKIKASIIIFLTFNCAIVYGQADTTSITKNFIYKDFKIEKIQFIIKTDILSTILSAIDRKTAISLIGEICFNHRYSFQLSVLNKTYYTESQNDFTMQGISDYKFFLDKNKSYSGFYTGAYIKTTNYSYKSEMKSDFSPYFTHLEYTQTRIGGGIICGYQNYIQRHFVIDVLIGYGALYNIDTNIIKSINIKLDNQPKTINDIRLALNLGYKF